MAGSRARRREPAILLTASARGILSHANKAPACGTAVRADEEPQADDLAERGLAWLRKSTSPKGGRRLHITEAGRRALLDGCPHAQ